MIQELFQAIVQDPREYLPFLMLLVLVLGIWLCFCVCAVASASRFIANRKLRLFLALGALLPALICVCVQIPISVESGGTQWSGDLRWLFFLPALLGLRALVKWWKDSKSQVPMTLTTGQDLENRE